MFTSKYLGIFHNISVDFYTPATWVGTQVRRVVVSCWRRQTLVPDVHDFNVPEKASPHNAQRDPVFSHILIFARSQNSSVRRALLLQGVNFRPCPLHEPKAMTHFKC